MKIGIEARALSMSAGVRRYTLELIRHLLKQAADEYVVLYDQARLQGTFPQAQEITVPLGHELLLPWWLQFQVPRRLQSANVNVVHYTKAAIPRTKVAPTVVTIYDIIPILFPASQKWPQRWYWPRTLRAAAAGSDHVITISEQSKRDIIKHLGIAADKITVTPLAINANEFAHATDPQQASVKARYQLTKPYVLFVGTLEPRKNIPALLRAFAAIANAIPHDLVIAGRAGWRTADTEAALRAFPYPQRLHRLAYIPPEDLSPLYSAADVFVWPSVYEGWGFPPQEAMACGTPVIVSSGGSLPQVVGQAGRVVPFTTDDIPARLKDAAFETALAAAIGETVTNQATLQQMSEQGMTHVKRTTWEDVAKTTRQVYQQVSH